jgi:hypothetical protein
VTLSTRFGGKSVQMAEFELYGKGRVRLKVVAASNPGGKLSPGFEASKVNDGDDETKWLDETGQPIVLDIGTEAVVEGYR